MINMIVARKTFFRALFDGDFATVRRILKMVLAPMAGQNQTVQGTGDKAAL